MRAALLAAMILYTIGGALSASASGKLSVLAYTHSCSPRKSSFGYTFTHGVSESASATALVLQIPKTWSSYVSKIAADSQTNITGLRFSLGSLSAGSSANVSFDVSALYSNTATLLYGVVLSDGTVQYGYLTTGGPWPYVLSPVPDTVTMNLTIFDFGIKSSTKENPDFERSEPYDRSERNISCVDLVYPDRLPAFCACSPSTSGCTSVESSTTFGQWFQSVSGVNKALDRAIVFKKQSGTAGIYRYNNQTFFPIDGAGYGNEGKDKSGNYHNFGFCMAVHSSFQYHVGDIFNFKGDDDVWVFIDGTRALDLGGVHGVEAANITLDDLGLTPGNIYDFDFFYCERHTTQSTFAADMTLTFDECGQTDPCGFCQEFCTSSSGGNDTDGDGYYDCEDACPYDSNKQYPGYCGCGKTETCPGAPDPVSSSEPVVISSDATVVVEESSTVIVEKSSTTEVMVSSSATDTPTPVVEASSSSPNVGKSSTLTAGAASILLVFLAVWRHL